MGNASVRESATGMPREYAVLIDLASATIHPLPALSEGIGDPLVTPMILGVRREP
jgi:hypothetical protein